MESHDCMAASVCAYRGERGESSADQCSPTVLLLLLPLVVELHTKCQQQHEHEHEHEQEQEQEQMQQVSTLSRTLFASINSRSSF